MSKRSKKSGRAEKQRESTSVDLLSAEVRVALSVVRRAARLSSAADVFRAAFKEYGKQVLKDRIADHASDDDLALLRETLKVLEEMRISRSE